MINVLSLPTEYQLNTVHSLLDRSLRSSDTNKATKSNREVMQRADNLFAYVFFWSCERRIEAAGHAMVCSANQCSDHEGHMQARTICSNLVHFNACLQYLTQRVVHIYWRLTNCCRAAGPAETHPASRSWWPTPGTPKKKLGFNFASRKDPKYRVPQQCSTVGERRAQANKTR